MIAQAPVWLARPARSAQAEELSDLFYRKERLTPRRHGGQNRATATERRMVPIPSNDRLTSRLQAATGKFDGPVLAIATGLPGILKRSLHKVMLILGLDARCFALANTVLGFG